jgi:predicted ATPase
MTYGLAIKTSQGYAVAAVGEAYARARELCRQVDDPARVVPVLIGLAAHHVVSGNIRGSHDVSLEMLGLFERLGDPHLQMIGLWSVGAALFHLGELDAAHDHLARALELYDPAFHTPRVWQTGIEPGIFCRCEISRTLTLRGYPDQGIVQARQAVEQARAIDHPQPLAFALLFEIFAHLAVRSPAAVMTTFEELSAVCKRHGIAQELQWAMPLRARAGIELGDTNHGVEEIAQGLSAHELTRSALLRPYYLVLHAGALLRAERWTEAQRTLDEAASIARVSGQHAYDAEHARIQATLLVRQGIRTADAEHWFARSLAISRSQGARWLELRSARAYADFLVHAGRSTDARDALQPIVSWFTEGHRTIDYAYAEALLKTLT